MPRVSYPPELPIAARADEIVAALRAPRRRVVIVSGETGCGKSTQIPKMCLEAGRGVAGRIGVTQPRRLAAMTIAHRIAEELGEPLGRSVGYKIRFQDRTSRDGYIKVMTDGILLAETQGDRFLHEYDTIIIDEAHERSLNIDFLLGIVRRLLDDRPDLKLVITSATLDTEKFSKAFKNAPVIEVSGRLYPVEVEYRVPDEEEAEDKDYVDQAVEAVEYLRREKPPGDILVFMPTEQDILETCRMLEGRKWPLVKVLPLFSRLPAGEQRLVYTVTAPKIVVATNVAETSLTIPGIRYVVDTGVARIAQYQPGTRINSLPISPISRASADQRKGRCGRVKEGLCVRLYSQVEYEGRDEFTSPEILRSDLAEVILRMTDLGLGDPLQFPFIDRPASKAVHDGYDTLVELGAKKAEPISEFPLGADGDGPDDGPHAARSAPLAHAGRGPGRGLPSGSGRAGRRPEHPRPAGKAAGEGPAGRCRARSVQAPRLGLPRPAQHLEPLPRRFREARLARPEAAFLPRALPVVPAHARVGLPAHGDHQGAEGAGGGEGGGGRRRGKAAEAENREIEYHALGPGGTEDRAFAVSPILHTDISPALYGAVHRSILSGYLSNIAVHKEKNQYTGAKNREVMLWPGSVLFGKGAGWIVSTEVVRTSRLFARTAARIDPAWLEKLGGPLCKRAYSDAAWDRARGEVTAKERVTLFGLEIVRERRISYGRVAPAEAHEIFVMSGLVEGAIDDPPPFLEHNLALQRKVEAMEEKLRRRDILVAEGEIAKFYAERLPGIRDVRSLRKLLKDVRDGGGDDAFLRLSEDRLLNYRPEAEAVGAFPDSVEIAGRPFRAVYKFAPGEDDDGVTLSVPVGLLRAIPVERLEWGVAGQYRDKIAALIKGLPKRYRKLLVPVGEKAETIAREMPQAPEEVPLFKAVAEFVRRRFGIDIPAREWALADVPKHLRMRVEVVDPATGKIIDAGRDVDLLRKKIGAADQAPSKVESPAWQEARRVWERDGITEWDFGDLPEKIAVGTSLTAFPALKMGDMIPISHFSETQKPANRFPPIQSSAAKTRPAETGDLAGLTGKAGASVAIRLFPARAEAEASHRQGVRALLMRKFAKELAFVRRYHKIPAEHERAALYFGGREAVEKAIEGALARDVLERDIRTEAAFKAYEAEVGRTLFDKGHALTQTVIKIIELHAKIRAGAREGERGRGRSRGRGRRRRRRRQEREDPQPLRAQQAQGARQAGIPRRGRRRSRPARAEGLPRGLRHRPARPHPALPRGARDPARAGPHRTRERQGQGRPARAVRVRARAARGPAQALDPHWDAIPPEKAAAVEELRWMIEEFKLSLFAPEIKTAFPISAVRLARKIAEIDAIA